MTIKNKKWDYLGRIDYGIGVNDYETYRADFPDELFPRLAQYGVGLEGQKLLDLGAGTGALSRGFAKRGCDVTALDVSTDMLAGARRRAEDAGLQLDFVESEAEDTPFDDESFDVVTAGQCWHWFDRDRAAAEAMRILKKGGKLAICHFDYLPLKGNVVEATEDVLAEFNPDFAELANGGLGIHPRWPKDVAEAGFVDIETFSFDLPVSYSHEYWRGRMRACGGVTATLPPEKVAAFDAALAEMLRQKFPEDPLSVPHRVFAVVCAKEGG